MQEFNIKANELLIEDTYLVIEEMDPLEKSLYKERVKALAKEVGIKQSTIDGMFRAAEKAIKEDRIRYNKEINEKRKVKLEVDNNGVPAQTTENYLRVLREDEFFSGVKFNELSNCPEIHADNEIRRWSDSDDARARHHIEKNYSISSPRKYDDAIRIIFDERRYHPVKDIIETIEWDGQNRIEFLLENLLGVEPSEYTREVSRLIFAGGIHRIYRPGCKFDDVPVLIGTKQGEGKSTFCRWLALEDRFFREVNEIDGQKGMEAIEGGWICELSELLALTKAKEVEAVKSYITKQTDHYRMPYDKRTSDIPRQCVFVGTTNKVQFLTDKTGNRRFYPITVNCNGYDLLSSEDFCREYIRQCWAEALHRFRNDDLQPFAKKELISDIREAQMSATEDDSREGMMEEWLKIRSRTCCIDVWQNCLHEFGKPPRRDSNEIVQILTKLGWECTKNAIHFSSDYGNQRTWTPKKPRK